MLESLKNKRDNLILIKKAVQKGISKEDLDKNLLKAIVDFGDLELICMYARILDAAEINDFYLLIVAVYKNMNYKNLGFVSTFIDIINIKGSYISTVFSEEINNIKKKESEFEAYVLHKQGTLGL